MGSRFRPRDLARSGPIPRLQTRRLGGRRRIAVRPDAKFLSKLVLRPAIGVPAIVTVPSQFGVKSHLLAERRGGRAPVLPGAKFDKLAVDMDDPAFGLAHGSALVADPRHARHDGLAEVAKHGQ